MNDLTSCLTQLLNTGWTVMFYKTGENVCCSLIKDDHTSEGYDECPEKAILSALENYLKG